MSQTSDRSFFGDFEVEKVISEPSSNYLLFQDELVDHQVDQLKILECLEFGLPIFNGSSFSNQVHFQTAYQIPVQRWFPYMEGYSIKLVQAFLSELKITGNVFDPFAGSGTTLLASRQRNLDSFGIDVNPISVLVARVENEKYLDEDIEDLQGEISKFALAGISNEIFSTPFNLAEKVFNKEILQALLWVKSYILRIESKKTRSIFFVAWLSIIEEVSNIKKEGNGIKYKNRKRTPYGYINIDKELWEAQVFPDDKFSFVKFKLLRKLEMIINDIKYRYGNSNKKPAIIEGDCLNFDQMITSEIQLTFFSPPYCNCFDYFEIHKVELWLGGFVNNQEEFKTLRNTGFRSNTNSLNHKSINYRNDQLEKLLSLLDKSKLWNNRIPEIIRGYFDDTNSLLSKLYNQTVAGGYVGIVIGNSAYGGVIIPSDLLTIEIARSIGFKVERVFVTRHLTTSSQQKKNLDSLKNYLRESIVLLRK